MASYTELQSDLRSIINFTDPDIDQRVPTIIAIAEKRVNGDLICPEMRDDRFFATSGQTVTLTGIQTKRFAKAEACVNNVIIDNKPLRQRSKQLVLSTSKTAALWRDSDGDPKYWALDGRRIWLSRPPSDTGSINLFVDGYWTPATLGQTVQTHAVLEAHYTLYLYGAAMVASSWLPRDEQTAKWGDLYRQELKEVAF